MVRDKIISRKNEGDEIIYDRLEILKALGIDAPVDEPFITREEAAEILNLRPQCVVQTLKRRGVPHYSFKKGAKGAHYLFLRSDLEAYKKIETELDYGMLMSKYLVLSNVCNLILKTSLCSGLSKAELDIITQVFRKNNALPDQKSGTSYQNEHFNLQRAMEKIINRIAPISISEIDAMRQENVRSRSKIAELKKMLETMAKYKTSEFVRNEGEINAMVVHEIESDLPGNDPKTYKLSIFDLPARAVKLIDTMGTKTLGDLTLFKRNDALKYRDAGAITIQSLDNLLERFGLSWWSPEDEIYSVKKSAVNQ